ncbi:sce7725 family protein [Pedobacter xixiisoli]|uniref:Sce7725 family protein n=1 Tax=Pedobacter xixiisoli TaxID=1476464 RepID=A0A285ZZR6_9SPHI|nr:sce7725 family protein [Pedobacter xixiisoli]SOD15143.1 hypothetical protein SAMN06297358_2118 [Pedobacter xixiisoli]
MYYPFLRARQFELISIRELVADGTLQDSIIPVLEPVKEEFGNLNIAHDIFQHHEFNCFLIVNPQVGQTTAHSTFFLDYISQLDHCRFHPAFIYTDNEDFIQEAIADYGLENCMIIGLDSFSNDIGFKACCAMPEVTEIMLLDPGKYRGLDRHIKTLGKNYIRLDDLFEKQAKNADFLEIPGHKFSEEHLYYREENYQGFSDFTTLPSLYVEGGSTPRAVVIHLTYQNEEDDNTIWIRHFTSESNDSIANVQGKFAQAAEKAIAFCDEKGINNVAIEEIRKYLTEGRYPGLGTVKKISIKNHLIVVDAYLLR